MEDGDEQSVDLAGVPWRFLPVDKLQQVLHRVDGLLDVDAQLGGGMLGGWSEDHLKFLLPYSAKQTASAMPSCCVVQRGVASRLTLG